MKVQVPEKNTFVDFPDDATPEEIKQAIDANWDSLQGPPISSRAAGTTGPYSESISAEPEQTLWQKFRSWVMNPNISKEKAQTVYQISKETGKTPTEALHSYEEEVGKAFETQTPKGVAQNVMTGAVTMGLMTHPIATIAGLATFFGMDWLEQKALGEGKDLSDVLDAEGLSRDAIKLAEFALKGTVAGGVVKAGKGPAKAGYEFFSDVASKIKDRVEKINFINDVAARVKRTGASPDQVVKDMEVQGAAHEAATSPQNDLPQPTEAQKQAGNYKMGHTNVQGLDVTIENPAGSVRSGTSPEGKPWETEMKDHYGYIRGTEDGGDGKLDVFVGENPESQTAFVVKQVDPKTGRFDENKVMLGYDSIEAAKEAYLQNYEPGWKGLGDITEMPMDQFREWVKAGDTTKEVPGAESLRGNQEVTEAGGAEGGPEAVGGRGAGVGRENLRLDAEQGLRGNQPAVEQQAGKVALKVNEYQEARVPVPDETFDLVGVPKGNVFANYNKLHQKHSDQFASPEEVKTHVEYVMEKPTGFLPATKETYTLVYRRNGGDKATVVEFVKRGGKYRVRLAFKMSEGQLERKIKKARRGSSEPPSSARIPSQEISSESPPPSSGEGRIEPSGTRVNRSEQSVKPPVPEPFKVTQDTTFKEFAEARTGKPLSQIGDKSRTYQRLVEEFNAEKQSIIDAETAARKAEVKAETEGSPRTARQKPVKGFQTHVREHGWIDPDKWVAAGYKLEELPIGMRKKGGLGPDEMVTELINEGIVPEVPESVDSRSYFASLVRDLKQKKPVTYEQMQKRADDAMMEKEAEFEKRGLSEEARRRIQRELEADTQEEVARLSPEERLRESERDPDFLSEEDFIEHPENYSREGKARTSSELFDTSDQFTLSGDQKADFRTMKATETGRKGERLLDVEKATTDEIYDRQKAREGHTPSGNADVGGYAKGQGSPSLVEMPEIVEIAKSIAEGKAPRIKSKLRIRDALGVFYSKGKGWIELRADIFKDPIEAAKVMAHEIGHFVDYLPDRTMDRGNILGRIASLKKYVKKLLEEYPGAPGKVLNEADRARLKAEAKRQIEAEKPDRDIVKDIVTEVPRYREVGVTREMIMEIMTGERGRERYPDLYEWLARQPSAVKKEIVVKALKDVIDERLKQFSHKEQIGTEKVVTRTVTHKAGFTQADVEARFRKLLQDEIDKRKLYQAETITAELKTLTQKWKPFDEGMSRKFTKYRYSSKELYADAFSVLLNDPKLLKDTAPSFYKAFFSYMERKPEVKAIYEEIQNRLGDQEAVLETREQNIREMFAKDREQRLAEKKQPLELKKAVSRLLLDKNMSWYKRRQAATKAGRQIDPEKDPWYWTEELPYIAGKILDHYNKTNEIVQGLAKDKVNIDDIGEYMMLKRIAGERAQMANPLGHTSETALKQLDVLKTKVGDEAFRKIEDAVEKYWKLRESIFDDLEKSDMLSDRLLQHIKVNKDYATFDVQGELEAQYGRHVSSHIYKQIGTLAEIRNPFVATLLKDAALIRAAEVTKAKRDMMQFLKDTDPTAIAPAETRWNGKYHEPQEPRDPNLGMTAYLQKGKVEAYYVPRDMAETFYNRPFEGKAVLKAIQAISAPLKAVLVNRNPIWMLRNLIRDFKGTAKQIPGLTASRLVLWYVRAFKDAFDDAARDKSSATISKMLQEKMLVVDRQFSTRDIPGETVVDQKLMAIGENPVRSRNFLLRPLVRLSDALDRAGRFSERWAKVAGYKYLETRTDISPRERAHLVRTRVGTPDPYRAGTGSPVYNTIFLFSNIGKEGFRAFKEAAMEHPVDYTWKTVKYNILPKLIMLGMTTGLMGTGVKKIMDGVSEYDKTNYLVVPLWLDENGKSVYLRIPQDYTGQVIGGLAWKLINGRLVGKESLTAFSAGQTPYSLNPYISVADDLITYYGLGINPYDSYRGRNIMSDQEYRAGGKKAHLAMARDVWGSLGGTAIYRIGPEDVDKQKSLLEKMLQVPPGTIVGTFLKVSNQGERERYRETLEPVGRRAAGRQLDVRDRIIEQANAGKTTVGDVVRLRKQLVDEGLLDRTVSVGQFRQRFNRIASRRQDSPKIDAVANAATNEEKVVLLSEYRKEMQEKAYNDMVAQLRRERLVSGQVIARARRASVSQGGR